MEQASKEKAVDKTEPMDIENVEKTELPLCEPAKSVGIEVEAMEPEIKSIKPSDEKANVEIKAMEPEIEIEKASDDEREINDNPGESSRGLVKNEDCCNVNCQTVEYAKLIVARPYVLSFYGLKIRETTQRLVCEVCRNMVDIQNEDMMQALEDRKPVFDVVVEAPKDSDEEEDSTIEITISDSDSSDEPDPIEPNLAPETVKLVNENLSKMIDEALERFGIQSQVDEAIDEAKAALGQTKKVFEETVSMLEEVSKRADVLQNVFYNTFANRNAVYRNAVEIVDVIGPEGVNRRPTEKVDEESQAVSPSGGALKGVAMKKVTQMPRKGAPGNAMHPPSQWAAADVSLVKQVQVAGNNAVPPLGVLSRPALRPGDVVYVMKNGIFGTWIRGQIDEVIPKGRPVRVTRPLPSTQLTSCVSYRLKFQFLGKAFSMKTVNGKQLAYVTPSAVRYPVGTRVIAIYKDVDVPAGSFYAGIVAEPPKEVNKHRYLIFFDDGYTQYVSHDNVLLVTEASKNVYEDVHPDSRDFIKQYLENFPERPMLKLSLDQVVKTEWNGKWWLANVVELDCSLCNMSFLADARTEWLYRGSTRLAPLYKLQANDGDGTEAVLAARPPKRPKLVGSPVPSQTSQGSFPPNKAVFRFGPESSWASTAPRPFAPSYPALAGSNSGSPASRTMSSPASSAATSPTASSPSIVSPSMASSSASAGGGEDSGPSRAVAKKSTSSRPAYMSTRDFSGHHAEQALNKYLNQVPGSTKTDLYASAIKISPKKFEPHQCGPACISWIAYVPESTKHCGPLTVPLLHGFQRQFIKYRNKKAINYRAPCGRRIRNGDELSRYLRITKSRMGVDFFDFNYCISCLSEFVVQRSYLNIKDLSDGREYMPIPCINYIDHSYPDVLDYSATRLPVAGVNLNLDADFLTGCDCNDGCVNKDKCSCWQLTFAGTDYGQSGVVDNTIGYSHKRLIEPVLTGIYECNSRCKCSSTCANRVVQNPLRAKLQVFKTPHKGWGIRSINDMPQGSFICIYAGRLLNEHEANEGGKECGDEYLAELDYIEVVERLKEGYEEQVKELFGDADDDDGKENGEDENAEKEKTPGDRKSTMETESEDKTSQQPNVKSRLRVRRGTTKDISRKGTGKETKRRKRGKHSKRTASVSDDEDSNEPAKPAPKHVSKPVQTKSIRHYFNEPDMCYIMDAKVSGNIGRYLNHSCAPNVFVQNVFVDTHDLRFPWVAFFALAHIRAGTELTWDYNYDIGSVPNKLLLCRCGSIECRGRLL